MRHAIASSLVLLLIGLAQPAAADLFAFEVQGQAGFSQVGNLKLPGAADESGKLGGFAFGARGRLQVLFLTAMLDYQHFLDGADLVYGGLGVHFSTDLLPVIRPYVCGSVGLMLLAADAKAFSPDAPEKMSTEAGGYARAGGGLEIPFAGDFLAFGVSANVGVHYITGQVGYDFDVMGYLGLRI